MSAPLFRQRREVHPSGYAAEVPAAVRQQLSAFAARSIKFPCYPEKIPWMLRLSWTRTMVLACAKWMSAKSFKTEVMPKLVGFSRSPPYLRSRSAERSAAAFSPATKEWSYGGASGPGSMSSRTVTQMSRSYGCSRKIRRTSLYARSFVSPFSAFPRATFLVSAFLNVRICANHSALTSRWRDGTGAEGAAWAWDGHPLGGMAKAPCLSIN